MTNPSEPVSLGRGVVMRSREMSVLIKLEDYENDEELHEVWLPRSQLHDAGDIDDRAMLGDTGEVFIPHWLATKQGLI